MLKPNVESKHKFKRNINEVKMLNQNSKNKTKKS